MFCPYGRFVSGRFVWAPYLNPFTPMCRKTAAHFRQFLTVLEYSSMKFPPITAPCTLYTVKKKNLKIFNTFSVLKV
jgi:hypothetical protein